MPCGYMEGPASEEREPELERLERPQAPRLEKRAAVYGQTADDPAKHFIGWLDEVDSDELFASGEAWGLSVVRRAVPGQSRPAFSRSHASSTSSTYLRGDFENGASAPQRIPAQQACAARREGALLVDTRSADEQREQGGVVPGAIHHPLSIVLWRLDALPRDTQVILICRHGYASSLAAAQLHELGFGEATDVEGGFEAWQAAGPGRATRLGLAQT